MSVSRSEPNRNYRDRKPINRLELAQMLNAFFLQFLKTFAASERFSPIGPDGARA
jgi:hypothetical protein